MNTLSFGLATRQNKRLSVGETHRPKHYLYRAIVKARSLCSNRMKHSDPRKLFQRNPSLFGINEAETQHLESLLRFGFFSGPGFFSKHLIDRIYTRADAMFRRLQIEWGGQLPSETLQLPLNAFSYGDLARDRAVELSDPLVNIPEILDIAFHESILKIVAHFFRCIPSRYRVAVIRTFPSASTGRANDFRQDSDESDDLQILVDLTDVDKAHGPLIYVPGSNHCGAYRASKLRDAQFPVANRPLGADEVERTYPRDQWITLLGERGTICAIHGKGIHSGPFWGETKTQDNRPRTSIRIEASGYRSGVRPETIENRIRSWNFERMTGLQQLFAHANLVEGETAALARAG